MLRSAALALGAITLLSARDAAAQFTGIATNGSAAVLDGGSTLQLTPNLGSQAGSAFFTTPLALDAGTAFTAGFRVSLQGTPTQADGIALVLQSDPRGTAALGAGGGAIGYSSSGAITPSVALTLQTYFNNDLAIGTNGQIGNIASTQMGNLGSRSSNIFDVVLSYGGGVLTATAINAVDAAESYTVSGNVNLASVLGPQAYVGFTGGTGANAADQRILSYGFSVTQATVPEPATVALLGVGLVGMAGIAARRRRA
ncbi:hypothetical protein rosag_26250 [Roseisolibacter agri]|uniref:PEP-CTERM motif protein n=1 Tax=Roseisolibacter agri TaxID=2014610 RepID=A0AA37V347_9BACT|nr:hypothetical protein rosag_26250 [Roseisolibacter agri]